MIVFTILFILFLGDPPVLTIKATNTSKGGRLAIYCTANGVPNKYTFSKWTQIAPDENRTIVSELEPMILSDSEVSVTRDGATYQDTGFYVCKASNGITKYSTGQLIMEEMVSVLVADQPRITLNARDFDAEKGKSGQMHIEFYSGLFQPIVTWYHVRNFTMERLQNSHDFKISLSVQTVELHYHQKTVRLPGFNASLEIVSVNDDHFTSYKVEINNSIGEPITETLELKPRGPPETPTNFNVVPRSVTSHSLQLTWQAGFHGGASQTFVIEYREAAETAWLNKLEPLGLIQHITLNTTITDLKAGTKYEFRIYSINVFNQSQASPVINETTEIAPSTYTSVMNPVPAIAGGVSAGYVVILIVTIGIFLWRRNQHPQVTEQVITLENNRNTNIRPTDVDLYEKLNSNANSDIQMYSSLNIQTPSEDHQKYYENT